MVGEDGVISSRYPSRDIPHTTIPQEILAKCDVFGNRIAMIDGPTEKEWTFAKLAADARALAAGLAAAGLTSGDVVALFLPNCPEYFVTFIGSLLIGGVVTTLNPAYGVEELEHCLSLTKPRLIFTIEALLDGVQSAVLKVRASQGPQLVLLGPAESWARGHEGVKALAEFLLPGGRLQEAVDASAVAVLPYSSGTTGLPKAVKLSHRNIVSQLYQLSDPDLVCFSADTVCLAVLPFFHIYGMLVLLLLVLWSGAKVVTLPKFDPALYLKCLKQYEVTVAHVAPPLAGFLAKHEAVNKVLPLPKLRELFSGAAPLDGQLAALAQARLGLDVVRQGYGMTEMSPASHIGPLSNPKGGAIGVLLPNMEMKLVAVEDGRPVTEPGRDGELWLRGPNVMQGYLDNDAATQETLDEEGFLHTGDVARLDEDGQVWIVDRIKELIKVKGFQVAPAELEALLLAHPKVADAAVIGVAAGQGCGGRAGDGQVPKAFVVARAGEQLTEEEVVDFVKNRVQAEYKRVTAVEFLAAVPKTASGKILRKDLRKREEAAGRAIFA